MSIEEYSATLEIADNKNKDDSNIIQLFDNRLTRNKIFFYYQRKTFQHYKAELVDNNNINMLHRILNAHKNFIINDGLIKELSDIRIVTAAYQYELQCENRMSYNVYRRTFWFIVANGIRKFPGIYFDKFLFRKYSTLHSN